MSTYIINDVGKELHRAWTSEESVSISAKELIVDLHMLLSNELYPSEGDRLIFLHAKNFNWESDFLAVFQILIENERLIRKLGYGHGVSSPNFIFSNF